MRFIKGIQLPLGSEWVIQGEKKGDRIIITNTESGKIISSSIGFEVSEIMRFNRILAE